MTDPSILGRLRNMVARAIVGTLDDGRGLQAVQLDLLDEETIDGVEHFQHYGFTSVPHAEAEAIVVCPAGTRSMMVIIATGDRRYRLKGLAAGEVAIHDDQGQVVKLGRDGITIVTDKPLSIQAESVAVTADAATVTADRVDLGGAGGKAVARIDDMVNLNTGKIISGSDKVFAA